jgi:ligand-binding sensor domain-containing protein
MKTVKYVLILFIFMSWNNGNAQWKFKTAAYDPYFIESSDTVSNFGPRSITRNILQDKKGNCWFSTWQGIMRYDGKVFTNFTLKEGLMHFRVFSVLEDNAGNLWFGTCGAGVYRYDGKTFTLFSEKDGLINNDVLSMMQDKDGNIWLGTDNGVSRYDGTSFKNFDNQFNPLTDKSVNSIDQDSTGKIWFGIRYGDEGNVVCYNGRYFTNFKSKEKITFNNVRSIEVDMKGIVWIGGQDGLFSYDGTSLTKVSTDFICDIFEDKAGNLWISSGVIDPALGPNFTVSNTLSRFNGKTMEKITEKREKENNQIFEITQDVAGNIWFGTGRGTFRYDGTSVKGFAK